MARTNFQAERLQLLSEGDVRPGDGEQWVVTITSRLRRTPVAGPSPEAVARLSERFDALAADARPHTPAAWFRAYVLNHPKLQRAAAGLVLFVTAASGGAVATGHNPIDAATGAAAFVVDAVVSLDPRGKTTGEGAAPDETPATPATAEPTTPGPDGTTPTPEPSTEAQQTFPVLNAGVVTVAVEGAQLRILEVATAPGWTVSYDSAPDDSVEATFRSIDDELKFEAHLEGGEIRTSIERKERSRDEH